MNRRDFRKGQIAIRARDQELYLERLALEKEKLRAEITAIQFNTERLKIELKNIYKTCIEEVKKEKKEE